MDITLLILGILLVGTVSAYFIGFFVYPFGFLLLLVFFVTRILYIRDKKSGRQMECNSPISGVHKP